MSSVAAGDPEGGAAVHAGGGAAASRRGIRS
jgi:hypothetical protein